MKWVFCALVLLLMFAGMGGTEANSSFPLLYADDMTYIGGFRLPIGNFGDSSQGNSFSTDSGRSLAFNSENYSLFMTGHKAEQMIAELSIPVIVNSTTKADMNFASVIQNPKDPCNGSRCLIGPNRSSKCGSTGVLIGGFFVNQSSSRLIGTSFAVYNGLADVVYSHFTFNKTWSSGAEFDGMYRYGETVEIGHKSAGFLDGYMCPIPEEWQDDFGGDMLSGNACLAIVSRTSLGPSAFVLNSSDVLAGVGGNETHPFDATPVVYYSVDYPTLGIYDSTTWNENYNMATEICGIVFPSGTRTVLFFGRHGIGDPCYGPGTPNASEAGSCDPDDMCNGQIIGNGNCCCYDPTSSAKGVHGYPYAYYVWAYDAMDMIDARNGVKNPWNVTPYAVWSLNDSLDVFAPDNTSKRIFGATYDEINETVFISQFNSDKYTYEVFPIIQAFELNISGFSFETDISKSYFNVTSPIQNVINSTNYNLWNRTILAEDVECSYNLKVII